MNQVTWDYQGKRGPEMWGRLCPEFQIADTGKRQSPIDIKQHELQKIKNEPLEFHYLEDHYTIKRVENSVHAFPSNEKQGLTYKGTFYKLVAFHAHVPAEHLLDGKKDPIEWHFVHENAKQEKLVIGVRMKLDNRENKHLQDLAQAFRAVFPDFKEIRKIWLSINDFLPEKRVYYQYTGSLTTPPTYENVSWFVLKHAVTITSEEFAQFEEVIGGTARPVQPLNGRIISESE